MKEQELLRLYGKSWNKIILAQIAPTILLITTVALLQFGLASLEFPVRAATVLILLASGILGALAEFAAADEAIAILDALGATNAKSLILKKIKLQAKLLPIVKYVTPTIFVAIFIFLIAALLF